MKFQNAKENVGFKQHFLWHFCEKLYDIYGKQTTGSDSVKLNFACLDERVCSCRAVCLFQKMFSVDVRYGTLSLLAAIDLLTGEAIPLVSETHKSSDFVAFLNKLDNHYPKQDKIRIILDNHSAHTSKETRNFLATMPEGKIDREQANELEYVDELQESDAADSANSSSGSAGAKPVKNPEREKPKWEDTITNRMLHWSYTPEQKEEVKKALAAGVPKATILTYFYPEVTVEKMSAYRQKQ